MSTNPRGRARSKYVERIYFFFFAAFFLVAFFFAAFFFAILESPPRGVSSAQRSFAGLLATAARSTAGTAQSRNARASHVALLPHQQAACQRFAIGRETRPKYLRT